MKSPAKAFLLAAAAMTGLLTGCATAPKKECHQCQMKSDKSNCGTKANCSSKSTCRAGGNCAARSGCKGKNGCSGKGNCSTKGS
jgi:hypothetical protein